MSELNKNIRNFRTFRGISQESLAALLGKTKSVISNWERGANSPDPDSIESLCKFLDVTPNQIFGWESNPDYEKWQRRISETTSRIKMLKAQINSMSKEIEKLEKEQAKLEMQDEVLAKNDQNTTTTVEEEATKNKLHELLSGITNDNDDQSTLFF